MNEYVGKICPYCKTEFKENDDIVVCSICDMPHHKDCWIENQGCTTFGCLGTIKASDGSPSSVTSNTMQYEDSTSQAIIYCTRCGAQNASSSAFCCKCGNSLSATATQHTEPHFTPSGNNSENHQNTNNAYQQTGFQYNSAGQASFDSDTALYIGQNSEYYIPKFNSLKAQNKKDSWNWCSFLFAPYWFIYRKMYGYGAAILGCAFLLSFLGWFGSILALGGYITFGVLGNYIYMSQVDKNISQGKTMSEPYKAQYIGKVSGVNSTATILTVIGYPILISIINFA